MGKAILIAVIVVLIIYAFFDVLATPRAQVRILPKPVWLVLVFVPIVGAAAWIFAGTTRLRPSPPGGGSGRGPKPPRGPDDDPDYLRGL